MYLYLFLMSIDTSLLTSKKPLATRWEKIKLIRTLLALVADKVPPAIRTPVLMVKTLFRDRKSTRSFLPALRNAILHSFLSHVSGRQLQAAFPSTVHVLQKYCKKSQLSTENLESGVLLHWMGDKSAKKVILYSHGGGYGLPALDGHVKFLHQSVEKLQGDGVQAVVAWVDYGLTPTTKYPEIFGQGVECLRHVLAKGYSPSDIIIGGDSAGAALSLGFLSHIVHGHPSIAPLSLPASTRFAGALLLCPWINLAPGATGCESFKRNKKWDYINLNIVQEWASDFASADKFDEYSNPIQASAEWWEGLPVDKTLILAGGHECFVDDIVQLGERIKGAGAKGTETEVVIAPKGIHIECIMDAQLGIKHGDMATAIWDWLGRVW